MKLKKSPPVNLTRSEEELLKAVRTDPMLAQHLTDVLKNFKKETDTGMDAYQAAGFQDKVNGTKHQALP